MQITIRPAIETDQPVIRAIIRAAFINRTGLDWRRFLLAEDQGRIVGVGQVKPHADGSRELASLAVIPEYQGQKVGSKLVQALLAREQGRIYLFCIAKLAGYYAQFGFKLVQRTDLPPSLARLHRLGNLLGYTLSPLFTGHRIEVVAMQITLPV